MESACQRPEKTQESQSQIGLVLVSLLHAPVVTAWFIVNISLYKVSYYATTDDNIMSSGTDIGTLK